MTQTDAKERRIDWATLPHFASVIAPGALTVGALLFLAGHVQRVARLNPFGIDGMIASPSFQATMADGFAPLFVGTLCMAAFGGFLWLMDRRLTVMARKLEERLAERADKALATMAWVRNSNRVNMYIMGSVLLLSYAYISGALLGEMEANKIRQIVQSGCASGCAKLQTNRVRYYGAIIAQDAARTAIYTKDGTYILETKDIRKITPVRRKKDRSFFIRFSGS